MLNYSFLKRNKLHIVLWTTVAVYFFLSPYLFDVFVKKGEVQTYNNNLPPITTEGKIYIDGLDRLPDTGDRVSRLWGWAFLFMDKDASPEDYVRTIILESKDKVYTFPTIAEKRTGVQETFKNLDMNLVKSGFYTDISKDDIAPGIYKISVLFTHPNGTTYLLRSGRVIERTINFMELR